MRTVSTFNSGWRFHKGEALGAEQPAFEDTGWRRVRLPHDWSIEGPFSPEWASATGYLPGGIGWYRKTFTVPEETGGRVFLLFDGVYCDSKVWINGHPLGRRPNGFVSFLYDLTPFLHWGGENTVSVRVDHSEFADSRWYTGSGINRNVSLISTGPVHIAPWGVFASTPSVTAERAGVRVEVRIRNHAASAAEAQVVLTLTGPDGTLAAEGIETLCVGPDGEATASAVLAVRQPQLWSVDSPSLYSLTASVRVGGEEVDREKTRIGIRSFRFDPNEGFFLNGQPMKLKGVCIHDDAGALGTAVPPKVWGRRLRTLKAAGVNAIRMSHNPHMPELYDLCDEMGFLVQDEAFDEWEGAKNKWVAGWNVGTPSKDGYSRNFAEWAEADLRDMLLRDRNHPCIIMWSIGNEIDYPNDPYTHEILDVGTNPQAFGRGFQPESPHSDRLGEIARQLVAVVKRYDTTRPVTAALAAALISNETGFADALDVVGYNYQEYRYAEDHAKYPDRVLYGSENGMHFYQWEAVEKNPYISAQFLWTGIDYLGEAGKWPTRSNSAGLLDLAGIPKPEYHYRQSLWSDEPMVYIGIRDIPEGEEQTNLWSHKVAEPHWNRQPGEMVRIVCFTNCEGVELLVNGQPIGVKTPTDGEGRVLFWDLPFQPGTVRARGFVGGREAAVATLLTAGDPKKLIAKADDTVLKADGVDLAHMTVIAADENGTRVYHASPDVSWTVTGPARLLGLESGDPQSHEDYGAPHRRAFHGRLLGYVQSTEEPGDVRVEITAEGLESAVIVLRTES